MALFRRNKKSPRSVQPPVHRDSYQIPRFAFTWLLVALLAVILPHVGRMPLWLTGVCLMCMAGRVLIYQGRMAYPGSRIKALLVIGMSVGVLAQYRRDIFSTDANVGVLLVGITLKLLEMHRKRDVLMVIYLSYFTVVAEFIYSQSIPVAFYMTLVVFLITCALMSLNQTHEYQSARRTVKISAAILLQSAPLMLVFFLLFPRIGPLWSVPMQTNNGVTGLSENMSPGDIGNLIRSAAVAFRVQFKGEPPPYTELYWRAITLDEFDGKQWQRRMTDQGQRLGSNRNEERPWFTAIQYQGSRVEYNVILEPTYQNWIYTLQMPQILDDRMMMRRDFQVDSFRRISQRFSYDAISFLEYTADARNIDGLRGRTRRLPDRGNERAREFATNLRATVDSDEAYVNAVLAHFRNDDFFYTTSPALLGDNPIDEFLFDTREGFCEHYSSAFTYLMRAVQIPARVVTGYMGGEFNPYDGTLTVRQYDAHAWSEVWIKGRGWIRVDPTAAVAPERINQGSNLTFQEEESFMENEVFSLMRFQNSLLLNDLRLRLEMIDYAWNRFVVNYDQEQQFELLNNLFGRVTLTKILLSVVGFMVLMSAFIGFIVFRSSTLSQKSMATRWYLKFCKIMDGMGMPRSTGETPGHYAQRLTEAYPQWREPVTEITRTYTEMAYQEVQPDAQKLKTLASLVRKFRVLN